MQAEGWVPENDRRKGTEKKGGGPSRAAESTEKLIDKVPPEDTPSFRAYPELSFRAIGRHRTGKTKTCALRAQSKKKRLPPIKEFFRKEEEGAKQDKFKCSSCARSLRNRRTTKREKLTRGKEKEGRTRKWK